MSFKEETPLTYKGGKMLRNTQAIAERKETNFV